MKVKQYKNRKIHPTKKKLADNVPVGLTKKTPEQMISANQCEVITPSYLMSSINEQPVPTISSKMLFWRPRFLAESQWLQHIPFYFWLTDVLQPKTVVDPNLNSAVGYFAICQAIDKLNIDSIAYGAFGSQCDIPTIKAYNHEHYREFSYLVEQDEQTFINTLEDASIDLLLLKYDSVMLATEASRIALQKKLTDSAVVLIHGSKLSKVRTLSNALKKSYPSFELTQHQGLLLLCVGKQIPERLEALINQAKDVSAQRLIQNIYARLGSANEDAWQCRVYEQQVHELTEQLQAQTHSIQQIQGAKQQLADTLTQANNEVAAAKAQQTKLAQQLTALGEETASNREQKQALEQEKAKLDQELLQLKQSRKQATADIANLQQNIDARFDDLAKLTQMLVDAEHKLESVQQDNQTLREQLRLSAQELEQLKAQNQQGKQQCDELTASNTAQLTDNKRLKEALNQVQKELADSQAAVTRQLDEVNQLKRQQAQAQESHQQQLAAKQAELQQGQTAQSKLSKELADTKQQLQQANQSLTNANNQQSKLNDELTRQKAEVVKLMAQLEQATSELAKQKQFSALLERDQNVAADKISQLKQSELNLQQSLNDRFDELAILTNMLQQKEQELDAAIGDMQAAQQLMNQQQTVAVSDKLKSKFKAAKQRRAKARQFAKDVELIRQSELFDEAWYLAQYPEAKKHKHGAAGHYLEKAVELGANPSATFDGNWYLQTHQDVKSSGMNPLFHYLKFGHKETREFR
ncbi:hypothetical protein ACEUBL_05480 [Aeromonas veronii]